jgi:hypothetical protein
MVREAHSPKRRIEQLWYIRLDHGFEVLYGVDVARIVFYVAMVLHERNYIVLHSSTIMFVMTLCFVKTKMLDPL